MAAKMEVDHNLTGATCDKLNPCYSLLSKHRALVSSQLAKTTFHPELYPHPPQQIDRFSIPTPNDIAFQQPDPSPQVS